MTLHPPARGRGKRPWTTPKLTLREPKPEWKNAVPTTLGDVVGKALREAVAARQRRAELDAAGFKPLGGA